MNERQQTTFLRHGGWTKQRQILQQKIEDKKKGRKESRRFKNESKKKKKCEDMERQVRQRDMGRDARFLLVQNTKMRKNIPNYHELTKRP
jgi:hypothetical protein